MSVIDAGRAFHERSILKDTCSIVRWEESTFNPSTGVYVRPVSDVYSGVCHVAPITNSRVTDEEFGGEIVVTAQYLVKLPWSAVGIRPEDEVVVSVSEDPALQGAVLRVQQVMVETHQMSRRLICEQATPSETFDESSSEDSSSSDSSAEESSSG